MRTTLALLIVVLLAASCAHTKLRTEDAITVEELKQHVSYLASDELGGRKPGTPGGNMAATYIRDQFRKSGLKLLGDNGFQYFNVTTDVKAGPQNRFAFNGFEGKLESDFSPLSFSENASFDGPVVFAGYGFDFKTDSMEWNDYAAVDVKDKLVMILRGDPDVERDSSRFMNYSSLRKKVLIAQDHGAAGVIFVSGPKFDKADELLKVTFDRNLAPAIFPVVHIRRQVADSLLLPDKKTIAELEQSLNETQQAHSFVLTNKALVQTQIERVQVQAQNVLAMLEGSDPVLKNEVVIIGAHYDHLGMGGPGSGSRRPDTLAIHNGADDNASGVAGVLELAEKMAARSPAPKRSVLFMAFSAEEMGLLGSKYYTTHPLFDLKNSKFMINLDMIGSLDSTAHTVTVGGTGTAVGLSAIVARYDSASALDITQQQEGLGPSDHASFYVADVPVLFFFTGATETYHTPEDDTERINFEGEKMVVDAVYDIAADLINREEALVYQEAGPKVEQVRRTRFKVTLGIMPDYAGVVKDGLRVDAVTKGRPADKAGMKKGDIIVAMEGKPVRNIYEYMGRLGEFEKGQRISVDVIRNGKKQILIVEL